MLLLLAVAVAVLIPALLAHWGWRGRDQVVGIDLGTTFSVVALKSGGEVLVVPDYISGKLLVPSVVSYLPNGTAVAGSRAADNRRWYPTRTVFNAKRFMGKSIAQAESQRLSYPFLVSGNLTSDAGGEAASGFALGRGAGGEEEWYSPSNVGAEVLKHLMRSVEAFKGYRMTQAVICIPAKFRSSEVRATTEAFKQAGIQVMRVLEEPTAAAIAYNLHKDEGSKYVMVYDLGGGTLDTSLLFINGKSVSVLGTSGDDHLGGSDFDLRMQAVLQSKLGTAPAVGGEALHACDAAGLQILSEHAKVSLSGADATEVRCFDEEARVLSLAVGRLEYEAACADLFARALRPVVEALEDQMMTRDEVNDVVLVGGASRMPRIRSLLREFFGPHRRLHTELDPDVTVAYGAANILD